MGLRLAKLLTDVNATSPALPVTSGSSSRNITSVSAARTDEVVTIYVVDDAEGLTELYTLFLKGKGYAVRAFKHRAEALAALAVESRMPHLLIMDYLGDSLPVEQFIERCLAVHPGLRILMASGLSHTDVQFSEARPDRFLQKPFTAEEFLQAVQATLVASGGEK
jgi:DNA-binding response OmpR family regulator